MSSEDVKQAVREVLREFHESDGFCPRCCTICDMDPHEHRDHHQTLRKITHEELEADHRFIKEAREAVKGSKRVIGIELLRHLITAILLSAGFYALMKSGVK